MKPSQHDPSPGRHRSAAADPAHRAVQGEARQLADRHIRLHQLMSSLLREIDGPTIGEQVAADLQVEAFRSARHSVPCVGHDAG